LDEVISVVADWVSDDIDAMKRNAAQMRGDLGLTEQVAQKERFEGDWAVSGGPVKFSREWSGHRFTDEECRDLLAGKEITITAISAKKKAAGDADPTFVARGTLQEQEYNGRTYVGFKVTGFGALDASGNEMPPKAWCGHVFTLEEQKKLAAGEKVFADDFKSKKGKTFAATVSFAQENGQGNKKIIPEFG
jgi:DNA topoisomerase-3